ncbi:MAG: GSCFA domain-containing protein [Bacteroidaceae bacterium]|nr:GSCFA domain-containing protein [Bacteroidaceae bacterium]
MKVEETPFRTIVDVPKWTNPMHKDQHFVLLGSCFAQYIGKRFQEEGMHALCNPLGAAYNPESIAIQVRKGLEGSDIEESIFLYDDKWRCWWANTLLSDTNEEAFRNTIRNTFAELGDALRKADWLFITLGTNVYYELKEKGMIVANCHKVPGKCFEEVAMDVERCSEVLSGLMELLSNECPTLHVCFTVSPYRYKKYGFHGSQLAKATLLLAVDKVCRRFPDKANYFPAYEIMMDELRDYHFYAEDMIHPSPEAVNRIWEKLKL